MHARSLSSAARTEVKENTKKRGKRRGEIPRTQMLIVRGHLYWPHSYTRIEWVVQILSRRDEAPLSHLLGLCTILTLYPIDHFDFQWSLIIMFAIYVQFVAPIKTGSNPNSQ